MRTVIAFLIVVFTFSYVSTEDIYSQNYTDEEKSYTMSYITSLVDDMLSSRIISEESAQEMLLQTESLLRNPIDINSCSIKDLNRIPFLSEYQKYKFINFRTNEGGKFTSIYDLKLIDGWSSELIRWIHPLFICVKREDNPKFFSYDLSNIRVTTRVLYSYTNRHIDSLSLGSPVSFTVGMSLESGNNFRLYMSADKDRGEPLGHNLSDFVDHYGLSAMTKNFIPYCKVIIGDYRTAWGQGLVMSQNFNMYTTVERSLFNTGKGIRPVMGASESNFLRGLAIQYDRDALRFSIIGSLRSIDGVVKNNVVTSLSESGLHRTEKELIRRHSVPMRVIGADLWYYRKKLSFGASIITYDWENLSIKTPLGTYGNSTFARLKHMSNYSLSYSFRGVNNRLVIEGETAFCTTRGLASIHSIQYYTHKLGNVYLGIRYVSPDYWSYYSSANIYSRYANNEWGVSGSFHPFIKISGLKSLCFFDDYHTVKDKVRSSSNNHITSLGMNVEYNIDKRSRLSSIFVYRHRYDNGNRLRYSMKYNYISTPFIDYTYSMYLSYDNKDKSNVEYGSLGKLMSIRTNWHKSKLFSTSFEIMAFDIPSFASRIYYYPLRVYGDYSFNIAYGKGIRLSALCSYIFKKRWQVSGNLGYEKNTVRPYYTGLTVWLSLVYRK